MVTTFPAPSASTGKNAILRCRLLLITILCMALVSLCSAQTTPPAVSTSRMDNGRTGQNIYETFLTPANVNTNQFGALFNYPTDYQALAQPLYVPGVTINGATHNVVYVATMGDSVFAFDADDPIDNPNPLWSVNFTNPALYGSGITLASIWINSADLPCAGNGAGTVGFGEEGIAGTPVIDTAAGTIFVVAKTVVNGVIQHNLHALNIATGAEQPGSPVLITASSSYLSPITGKTYNTKFNSLHALNRPGLLLMNGVVYIAFGSNSCNDEATGWVLSYDESSLTQIAAYNTSPEHGLASIWQTGNGIAADEFNNVYIETGESCPTFTLNGKSVPCYDVNEGGATYSNSVIELDPNSLTVTNYFTPWDVTFLNSNDEDLSATGILILPDQPGPYPHQLVAGGKEGFVYVLDRDPGEMGGYNSSSDGVLQEFAVIPSEQPETRKDELFSSAAYWNNTVYMTPDAEPVGAFPLTGGNCPSSCPLGTPVQSAQSYPGEHSASVSANGTTNGIVWAISGAALDAFNATTMQLLYSSSQNKTRDTLPLVAHYATQTVVNGKVYIATAGQTGSTCTSIKPPTGNPPCPGQLSVYGLLNGPTVVSGAGQTAPALTTLPSPIEVQVINPYTGAGINGVTVNFSDGGKKGTFNPASAVSATNASGVSGMVSTTYTFSKVAEVVTITASAVGASSTTFTETAVTGTPTKIVMHSGNKQTGQAGAILSLPLEAEVEDANSNGVPGGTVTFVDKSGLGTLGPNSGISNASGFVPVSYQLPNTPGTYTIVASGTGLTGTAQFTEYSTGDPPGNVSVYSGNNQTAAPNTALSPLVVLVSDTNGAAIAGVSVVFSVSPAGTGIITGSPAVTGSNGQATANYTTGNSAGSVTITAAVDTLNTQFSVTVN